MLKRLIIGAAVILSGCVVEPARVVYVPAPAYTPAPPPVYEQSPAVEYQAPAPQPVVSVYLEPPIDQPPPVLVAWAPPPMLVETPTPLPYDGAIWTGGYWVWEGNWVWAHGRWASPPRPGYGWVNPYYENRGGSVVFVNGFWGRSGVSFVAPSVSVHIQVGIVGVGVIAGPRPIGPEGVFVPAPPGSHLGLIVPAPIGTAPAVVTSAPPIIHGGMHITVNNSGHNVTNITNVTNVTNVTVVAPASATANGQAVNASVPTQPHLAAALPPVVKAYAPTPASTKPIPAYVPGRQPMSLPPPQVVHAEVNPALMHQQHMAAPQAPAPQTPQAPVAPRSSVPVPAPAPATPSAPLHPASPASAPMPQPAAAPAPGRINQENPNWQRQNTAQPMNNAPQAPVAKPASVAPPAPAVKPPPPAPAAKPVAPAPAAPSKPANNQQNKPKEEGKQEKHEHDRE